VNDFQELVLKPKKVFLFSELLVTKNGEFLLHFGHLNCRLAIAAQRPTPGSLNYGSSAAAAAHARGFCCIGLGVPVAESIRLALIRLRRAVGTIRPRLFLLHAPTQ
jgi:hypothetical protein